MATLKTQTLSIKTLLEAERHLSLSCNVMAHLVVTYGPCRLANRKLHPFHTLVTSIIGQHLSAKAANTIEKRVREKVPTLCPSSFLAVPLDVLCKTGLSMAKAKYIIELSRQVNDGQLNFDVLRHQSNNDVIIALTELPGIGRWTAEMFLIFGLKRPDVLATGDTGLQRAVRLLYGETAKLESVGKTWKPYCSIASWYLWKYLDSN